MADVLQSDTKTRQELNAIRQSQQANLPLSPVHIGLPLPSDKIHPSRLNSVQKAYYRALQAHNDAQKKYETVKAELAQLSSAETQNAPTASFATTETDGNGTNLLTDSYVPLLRQRETHRKLLVLSAALGEITQVGNDAHLASETFETIAKREVGELPGLSLASSLAGKEGRKGDAEYDLLRLKKAILSTRRSIDEHEAVSASLSKHGDGEVDPRAELKALQKTHLELTMWMESQLGLIGDVQPPTPKDAGETNGTTAGPEFTIRDIEELYETYLASRARLLDLVAHPPDPTQDQPSSKSKCSQVVRSEENTTGPDAQDPTLTPSFVALPYLNPLLTTSSTTASLTNLTSHLRRTLQNSDLRTQDLLARLADESHLLAPDLPRAGGTHGKDWLEAGREAGLKTKDVAMKRVVAGLGFADKADGTLGVLRELGDDGNGFVG